MKFVKGFPWLDATDEERQNVKGLYRDTCDLLKIGYQKILDKVIEQYPVYKERANDIVHKSYNYSKKKGLVLYAECQKKAPGYWLASKNKCLSFLNKIKDKYSHRP